MFEKDRNGYFNNNNCKSNNNNEYITIVAKKEKKSKIRTGGKIRYLNNFNSQPFKEREREKR